MKTGILGQYRAGTGLMHRAPAGAKLAGLLLFALAVTVPPPSTWLLGAALVLVVAGYLASGLGAIEPWRQLIGIRWLIVMMLVLPLLFLPLPVVLANLARMVLVLLAAALVTLTTRTEEILDAVQRLLRPLRGIGVNPERVGLVLALTIRTIPILQALAAEIRDAQRARGTAWSVRGYVVPLLVQALRRADDTADALAARGVE